MEQPSTPGVSTQDIQEKVKCIGESQGFHQFSPLKQIEILKVKSQNFNSAFEQIDFPFVENLTFGSNCKMYHLR